MLSDAEVRKVMKDAKPGQRNNRLDESGIATCEWTTDRGRHVILHLEALNRRGGKSEDKPLSSPEDQQLKAIGVAVLDRSRANAQWVFGNQSNKTVVWANPRPAQPPALVLTLSDETSSLLKFPGRLAPDQATLASGHRPGWGSRVDWPWS